MRLFLAFPLPIDIIAYVGALQTRIKDPHLRLPASPHLTVKFLGDVDAENIDGLKEKIKTIRGKTIAATLAGVGAFADWTRPRVLWIGVEPAQGIVALQKQVEAILKDFPSEEKFHPHITLARVKDDLPEAAIAKIKAIAIEPRAFALDRLVLYRSVLTPRGPIYTEVHSIPLV